MSSTKRSFHLALGATAILLSAAAVSFLLAQNPSRNAKAAKSAASLPEPARMPVSAPQLTASDVDAFLDGFLPGQLQRDDVAGAVVIIVKNGEVLFSRGYGYADVDAKKPVSVDDTLFRPGSVSKTFTCTAVMQLVEQGKLRLDNDVNDYIDFKIPATYPEPVTLRRIMTHTAGFEEWDKGLFVASTSMLEPPSVYLPKDLPQRIFAPGAMPAYSNYAMSLAGYIVQRVSGENFADYISNHIYKPLGMIHSTFVQALPSNLAPLMSNGYSLGSEKPKPFELVNGAPAGSMSTSAADMSHFMIAHLQDGRYGDTQILRPETARLMHSRAYGPVPELNGMAICFFQENQNAHSIIGHGGDTQYFHSHMHLILDSNVGMFISLNSAGRPDGTDIRGLLWDKFLDRYFPTMPPLRAAISTAAADSNTVTGDYIASRRGETNITKIGALLGEMKVAPQPDGTIVTDGFKSYNGQPKHWREIAPMVYRALDNEDRIAFRPNSKGGLDIFTYFAAFGFQQASGNNRKGFVLFLIIFPTAVFVLALLLWPAAAIIRRHYHQPLSLPDSQKRLRILVRIVCLIDLAVIIAWFSFFTYVLGDIGRANSSLDPIMILIHIVEWIGVLGTVVAIVYAVRSWKTTETWKWAKLCDTIIALACIAWVWFAYIGNFLHFGTKF